MIAVTAAAAGKRLDVVLTQALSGAVETLSRSRLKGLIESGCVRVDGATIVEPSMRVKPGQSCTVLVPPSTPARPAGQAMDLVIAYEDDSVVVIDKPAGLVVHPAPGHPDRTLVNALIAHCGPSLTGIGGERRPGIVHRLDKDTSGLMVAAKTAHAHQHLVDQFARRSIGRAYNAVVQGVPHPAKGSMDGRIGRSPRNRKKMTVLSRGGKEALTTYLVLRRLGQRVSTRDGVLANSHAASLVECRLATGRTHQIRVHMAHAGHPVLGDPIYGRTRRNAHMARFSADSQTALTALDRQALHAVQLAFDHPASGARLTFESPLPGDIRTVISSFE